MKERECRKEDMRIKAVVRVCRAVMSSVDNKSTIDQGHTLNSLGGIIGDLVVYHSLTPAAISNTQPTVNNAIVAGELPETPLLEMEFPR
jgi:hypothetical protein